MGQSLTGNYQGRETKEAEIWKPDDYRSDQMATIDVELSGIK